MNLDQLKSELIYKAVRSSGAGGQNVNKLSTKVILLFDLAKSSAFSQEQKEQLQLRWANRMSSEGILQLSCDESRSQLKNKTLVTQRFFRLLESALTVAKARKPTKIPRSAIEKRIKNKRWSSEIKASRQKPKL
ncbi:aminoacyl-tRNA hydrolase [Flavobacterium sp. CYK-55]|uniref:alternative ribosome rescue aminoacyl-tRNA hydrolase ArfB n=1 Tax=Flavobacterium sp. CYK-55 TaxID=2835529 RepID=UPI001BCFE348|nr:alternative ribosome rescue aminoacyl-tRNA hydrolase ArfB [Flavobacterium sp. CYK-55]MBS7785944.1 aminoacyl-tRNA hydrolase [Flavobacterium sp. CYK-55]